MANNFFQQYPDNIVSVYCTGAPTVIDCGVANLVPANGNKQLETIGIQVFIKGPNTGCSMKINAYRGATLLGTSEPVTVAKVYSEYGTTTNFYGWIRFTFAKRVNMSVSQGTRFELELVNYTYDEANNWIGVVLDWPTTMGYNSSPGQITATPVAMELYAAEAVA